MSWQLTHNGTVKTLAEWGLGNVKRNLVSQGMDTVTFDNVVDDVLVDTQFEFGDTITMHRDGVQWFTGVVIQTPLTATPGSETHGFIVAGPWWYLEENIFQQQWTSVGGTTYTGHLLLNLTTAGTALASMAVQVNNTLQYLLDTLALQGIAAPYQIGTIDGDVFPPVAEVNSISCAAVLRLQMRWSPESVVWFDYTQSPPALHVRRRSSLTAKNIDFNNQAQVNIVPRSDLIRPSVKIQYERSSSVNGKQKMDVLDDVFPLGSTGRENRALSIPISVTGPSTTYTEAEVVTDNIDADNANTTTRLNWWKKYHEVLADPRYANLTINATDVTRLNVDGTPSQNYPRMLVEGQITEWMDFDHEQETIKAIVSFDIYDKDATASDAILLHSVVNEVISVSVVATDAASGTYESSEVTDEGDLIPVGLAEYLYNGLKDLHYDGDIVLQEEEVSSAVGLGNVLNITGGRTGWASMNALVQGITEDVDMGTTRLVVGPPNHLGAQDIMELLRVGRRFRWTNAAAQSSGELGDASKMSLGTPTANNNSLIGNMTPSFFTVKSGNVTIVVDAINKTITWKDGDTVKITIDMDDLGSTPADALPAQLRETILCVINPSTGEEESKKAMVLRTDTYD